jgi:ACS family sodium-dependent inorganic phosphate cotransporter-like MFS transporter 5
LLTSSLASYYLGWEYIFYILGGLGAIWFGLWTYFVYDSPATHPRISKVTISILKIGHQFNEANLQEELAYIKNNVFATKKSNDHKFPPLKKLFTNFHFLALIVAHTGMNFGAYTLMSGTPLFLNNIHHFSLQEVSAKRTPKLF